MQNAIYDGITYGPIFGNGCDIAIYDKCNQSDQNQGNINSGYDSKGISKIQFCGSETGNFKIIEYELYEVTIRN